MPPSDRRTNAGRADDLVERVLAGDRRALAQAITLAESTRPEDRDTAGAVLEGVVHATGNALRVGVSGGPGAGKSTLIDALGLQLVEAGTSLAVLAVDPSSVRSGGSILGDKTRMGDLSRSPHAYVRPSPTRGASGGIAGRTREAMLLCEAAGFDAVVIETVGVGQSELAVVNVVDSLVLLVAPGSGDDLQGVKRGVMEHADVVVVTKADGDLLPAANRAVADHRAAVQLLGRRHPGWETPVLSCSSVTGEGVEQAWQAVLDHRRTLEADGSLARRRGQQAVACLWREITDLLTQRWRSDPTVQERLREIEPAVADGTSVPTVAARTLVDVQGWG